MFTVTVKKDDALLRLGENVRRLRDGLNLSQEALAFESGLDRTYIGGVERGERNLTILSALKIAGALSVTLSELTKEVGHE